MLRIAGAKNTLNVKRKSNFIPPETENHPRLHIYPTNLWRAYSKISLVTRNHAQGPQERASLLSGVHNENVKFFTCTAFSKSRLFVFSTYSYL